MRTTGVNLVDLRENQQGVKSCNCKKSNCLKLYCDCFASSSYCSVQRCNCTACFNNLGSENSRRIAVIATVERNPNAFRSKILSSANTTSSSTDQSAAEVALHHKGCHCKKSNCLKKYCECFQLGIVCSDRCRCNNCKNFPGSVERNNIFAQKDSHFIRKTEGVLNVYGGVHSQPNNNYFSQSDAASSSSFTTSQSLPSSSSSRPPSSAPSSDESLVRRLDDLGDLLTHEVISKVCQTMLRTVISESKFAELLEKRRARAETFDDEKDHEYSLKKVKMDCSNDRDGNEYKHDQINDNRSDSIGILSEVNINQQSEENLSEEATKTMITSIIRAFGVSILSSVQSQPSHNEVDMSLGIAGLHSLKEKEKDLHSSSIRMQIPDGPIDVMDMTRTSGILALVSELCSENTTLPEEEGNPLESQISKSSVFSYSKIDNTLDPSKIDIHPFNFPQSSEEDDDETEIEIAEASLSRKVSQASRSLSVNSATTTEDQWSQDHDICHISNEKSLVH